MTLIVRAHLEDRTYWAEVDDIPGVLAVGDTEDELREAIIEALSIRLGRPIDPSDIRLRYSPTPAG